MPKPLASAFEALRASLWLIPSIAMLLAIGLAELMLWVSDRLGVDSLPFIFRGSADGAHALLQAIATSVITVAGVTFSVTILALQLTSTQFSPRVLRNFIRDRASQSVLATFLATFVYTLVVLGSVRTATGGGDPLVPIPAVIGALLLALISIAMLAFFIHHIAHMIQVNTITDSIGRETLAVIAREWPPERPDVQPPPSPEPDERETTLPARESGYVAYVGHEDLVKLASEADAVVRVQLAPGQWASLGRPLVSVAPPEAVERLRRDPRDAVELRPQPTLQQDVSFGIRQLVDVALKALSPSLNDPSTAVNCIHHITDILLEAGRRCEPASNHADEEGTLRVIQPQHRFEDLVGLAFDQLRQFGGDRLYVALAMADSLRTLLADLPPHRHPPVEREARLLAAAAESIHSDEDRRTVLDSLPSSR